MTECCEYFTIISDCYTIQLHKPAPLGEDNQIGKDLGAFTFWSRNYAVHDQGIAGQPLVLSGIEAPSCASDYDTTKTYGFCVPFCFEGGLLCVEETGSGADTPKFFRYFKELWEIMDNHEEIEISGLGSCIDAIYIIKSLKIYTVPNHGILALRWDLTLEKKRDS